MGCLCHVGFALPLGGLRGAPRLICLAPGGLDFLPRLGTVPVELGHSPLQLRHGCLELLHGLIGGGLRHGTACA